MPRAVAVCRVARRCKVAHLAMGKRSLDSSALTTQHAAPLVLPAAEPPAPVASPLATTSCW